MVSKKISIKPFTLSRNEDEIPIIAGSKIIEYDQALSGYDGPDLSMRNLETF